MKHWIAALAALLLATTVVAQDAQPADPDVTGQSVSTQDATGTVSVSSKGEDVRSVLYDMFEQTGRNFVLEPNIRFVLYLNLKEVAFDEALAIVCNLASLKFEVQNDIFYVSKGEAPSRPNPGPQVVVRPLGQVTEADLEKRLTTRFAITDIREVFAEFSKQTGVQIEVSARVPNYKLDAFLVDTTLKYALEVVTKAAGLTFSKTDEKSVLIDVKPRQS